MAASYNQFVASLRPSCSQALPGDVGHVLENYVGHSLAHVGERLDCLDCFAICSAITEYDFEAAVVYPHQSELHCIH